MKANAYLDRLLHQGFSISSAGLLRRNAKNQNDLESEWVVSYSSYLVQKTMTDIQSTKSLFAHKINNNSN